MEFTKIYLFSDFSRHTVVVQLLNESKRRDNQWPRRENIEAYTRWRWTM